MYRIVDHIFVHTVKGKKELLKDFRVDRNKVTVIPFGINDTAPVTKLSSSEAKQKLGFKRQQEVILFFGQIAPYKGLEYLIEALYLVSKKKEKVRLIIAGKVKKGNGQYWEDVKSTIKKYNLENNIVMRIEFIPDPEIEIYFKAADALIIPYVSIFQSGVLILSYYFGLPVIGTDVGELSEEIIGGETGLLCRPMDSFDLHKKILHYFDGCLYQNLDKRRAVIREYAKRKYSWDTVGSATVGVYKSLL